MNDRRRGLGRGLGALIPSEATGPPPPRDVFFTPSTPGSAAPTDTAEAAQLVPVPGVRFSELPIADVTPNPRQPRQHFDDGELDELAQSISVVGVLQPVVVRHSTADTGPRYELIMGERRWRASRQAGLQTIPALVRETQDENLLRDALLENLHRSQLNPLEEAAAYAQLLEDFGCTHDELAGRIGRSRPQISNTLRLLRLPPAVQRRVASGVLSAGHARALLTLSGPEAMEVLAARIVAEGLSVRSVEEIVLLGDAEPSGRARRARRAEIDPEVAEWSSWLSDRLDTRVTIAMSRRKGKMNIEFASKEDLERIIALLGSETAGQQRAG
ncbi:MAG: ParB/RepB/Spo0J family partition protein [Ornithinimicrobium sp.]